IIWHEKGIRGVPSSLKQSCLQCVLVAQPGRRRAPIRTKLIHSDPFDPTARGGYRHVVYVFTPSNQGVFGPVQNPVPVTYEDWVYVPGVSLHIGTAVRRTDEPLPEPRRYELQNCFRNHTTNALRQYVDVDVRVAY